ncbi:MAG TPA: hypothetical protein VIV11_36395 [Kofleriaceae bacterium]
MKRLALLLVVVAGCAHETAGNETPPPPTPKPQPGVALVTPTPAPTPPAPKPTTRVELTAVTLADDCGGTPPWSAPVKTAKAATALSDESNTKAKAKSDSANPVAGARAKRRCEQTSMQLAIIAGDASNIQVKSVELFDETGKSLGTLSASKPTRWSDASGRYDAWDETVVAGSTSSVSYVLTQPKWDQIGNRWNRTYTLKTVLSVGGVDQPAQKDVMLTAPTSLPPNVKT